MKYSVLRDGQSVGAASPQLNDEETLRDRQIDDRRVLINRP